MAKAIHKLEAVAGGSTLELTVTKAQGPVATMVEVGSTGNDDAHFRDSDLTPGPAVKQLDPANTYAIVWSGAFVEDGSATLRLRVLDAHGTVLVSKSVTVKGKSKEVFFRVVMLP